MKILFLKPKISKDFELINIKCKLRDVIFAPHLAGNRNGEAYYL